MSTDRLAEMAAEIERLRARVAQLEGVMVDAYMRSQMTDSKKLPDARREEDEIKQLCARITELEALVTVGAGTMGTLQQPTPDEPSTITHDIPPNAPR